MRGGEGVECNQELKVGGSRRPYRQQSAVQMPVIRTETTQSLFWLLPSSLAGFLPNEDIVTSLVYYDSLCVISRQVTKLKGQARELEKREQQRDYRRHPVIYLEKSRFCFLFFRRKGGIDTGSQCESSITNSIPILLLADGPTEL